MSIADIVNDLAIAARPLAITRENVDALLDTGQIQVKMRNGNWWEIRRNGATRRWKRDAMRRYIPFKYGMYGFGAITEHDFRENGALVSNEFRVKPPPGIV